MRNYMYLRPGNLYKDFIIEARRDEVNSVGRPRATYDDTGCNMLKGMLADADEQTKIRWAQLQHPVTHTIVQNGVQKAKPEDKLIFGNRNFFVQSAVDVGGLGIITIYYVEERTDVK